jgi:hypothetical protein
MNLPPSQSNLWRERYETLRRHFIESRQLLQVDPCALSVLIQSGMAAWMRAWQPCPATAPESTDPFRPLWRPRVAPVWQQELTRLIAHMTARHLHFAPRL